MTSTTPLVDSTHFQILENTVNFHFFSMVEPCILGTKEPRKIIYYLPIFIFIGLKFEIGLKFGHFLNSTTDFPSKQLA
jgi:hypothetical protein